MSQTLRPAGMEASGSRRPAGAEGRRTPLLAAATVLVLAGGALLSSGFQRPGAPPDRPAANSVRGRAAVVDSHLVQYGPWGDAQIAEARRHQLVIAHPSSGHLTRDVVARLQGVGAGSSPTIVLCYISVGEDLRTPHLSDRDAGNDPRFTGDGTGPRVDPRGPGRSGHSLAGIDVRGAPSPGGTGFASFYLDDNSTSQTGRGDGVPDRNPASGSYYVNAGDPAWFDVLHGASLDGADAIAGFEEIATTTHGRGLGCDGFFLDTVDTAAPNSYTLADNPNLTRFEWTAPGLSQLVTRLRATYPDKVIIQNRGLFYFDPRQPQYRFTTRRAIDLVLFESFRLDASRLEEFNPYVAADNRFNVAPRLMAEANRPDGFGVLSLGYAEGPPGSLAPETLLGASAVGRETLLEDVRRAHSVGFRHYLSNAALTLANAFALEHADLADAAPPMWSSTANDRAPGWPALPEEATPRIGVQEVVAGKGRLTVRWDVALDMNRVGYALYYQTLPFDFTNDPTLSAAKRIVPKPVAPAAYQSGVPGAYAHEATITGLDRGKPYYVVVRAFDESAMHHEERNTVVGFGRPA